MKIELLKQLRRECANKYVAELRCINGEKGWYLLDKNKFLRSGCCATKDIALENLRVLWHKEAEKYIDKHKDRCKTNYIW